jgi:superfamily I DNA/RNA helicase
MISKPDWKPAGDLRLEPNALLAVLEEERSLALTAGPGAGKTEMLAQKADYLLRTGGCRYPERILAIAFKVDASVNLRQRVQLRCGKDLAERFDSLTFHGFAKRLIDRFRPLLTGLDALDSNYTIGETRVTRAQITFGDLVPLALEILKSSEMVRRALAQTYTHVFLDEFQDCTNEQYQLIRTGFWGTGARLIAVGDTKQKIMGWAGALEGIFQTFAEDFNAKPLNLYQNFRSKPRLRRMQNEMVKVMDPSAAITDGELLGDEGVIGKCFFKTDDEEAVWLTEKILKWINEQGLPPSEIAVLLGNKPELYAIKLMERLELSGIPYRDEKQFQDLGTEPLARVYTDVLKCVFLDRAPGPYARLIELYEGRWNDVSNPAAHSRFKEFLGESMKLVRAETFQGPTNEVLRGITNGYLKLVGRSALVSLSAEYTGVKRFDDLSEQIHTRLRQLLDGGLEIDQALSRFAEDGAVRIMTVHKSKGLEFHTVIAMGIETQIFFGGIDSTRPTFFVQISRAKERLVLTCAAHRSRPDGYTGYWYEDRTPKTEFFDYATKARES